jgi:hypothetical protein
MILMQAVNFSHITGLVPFIGKFPPVEPRDRQ